MSLLYATPVRHCSADAAQASHLDQLLVPAEHDAHGRRRGLVGGTGAGTDLAEATGRLRCDLGSAASVGASHALVTTSSVSSPSCDWAAGATVHVFHQNVEALAAAGGLVDALQQRRHVAGLDRLEDLDNGLQMSILESHS